MMRWLVTLALLLAPPSVRAATAGDEGGGEVTLPLALYTQMVQQLGKEPRRAPAAYAVGGSSLTVRVQQRDGQYSASVHAEIQIETFQGEWTLVPLLPLGTALKRATVGGRQVQLVQGPDGIAWSTDKAGTVDLRLEYSVDARRSESGYLLPLPVPVGAASTLNLSFPGADADLAIVPSAELRISKTEQGTHYTAVIPATASALVTWRTAFGRPYVIGRADYRGALQHEAVRWTARFQVEVAGEEPLTLPLVPTSVTLSEIRADGTTATVFAEGGRFATVIQGRGRHVVEVAFEVPLAGGEGPPGTALEIPRVPVSHFELELPGKKALKVSPAANVVTRELDDVTLASVYVPMSDRVAFTWTDAVPDTLRTPFRANAGIYHAIFAEEGVVHGQATVVYEITHGETSQLVLEIPANTQVNRITAPGGQLADWAVSEPGPEGRRTIDVYLQVPVSGEYTLHIAYERLLGSAADQAIEVPLISADNVHRQRGMVALLSGQELALKPVSEDGLSRVGENQLPAFVRNQISMTVAHTYKYIEPHPRLRVETMTPERRQGKFNAQVDTLISLADVTMKGSATVELDVKSGSIMELSLRLPADVNVLSVSGPSLRAQQVQEVDGAQAIELAFTREMEGQFRIEVAYERIMDGNAAESAVPTISVVGAEVEYGRIAVEALTAVEVQASRTEQLSSLDINELPQQLVLKTTNPILMAYRYVHAEPPFRLALKITRHKEIDVQVAAIERAVYNSLLTRDGLAVTSAQLTVRNSRRQFLRLNLPPGSRVWSVFVDGQPEKPAQAGDGEGSAILIRMINASEGFPVEVVYATPVERLRTVGSVSSRLPRPDVVVTHTRWNVFLPAGPHYLTPDSTLDPVLRGSPADPRLIGAEGLKRAQDAVRQQAGQPLRLSVPAQGVLFAFEKLYADQSPEAAQFTIRYVSGALDQGALWASLAGVLLLWSAIVVIAGRGPRLSRLQVAAGVAGGIAVLVLTIGYLGTSPVPASILALAVALLLGLWWLAVRMRAWWARRAAPPQP